MNGHNPDILTCLANLSADEVFTPPKLASAMLDILPQDLFRRPDTTFLDPFCKSGVFLREIARRLNDGLKDQMPDQQARINHILTKPTFPQLNGLQHPRGNSDLKGKIFLSHPNHMPDAVQRMYLFRQSDPGGVFHLTRVHTVCTLTSI